MFSDVYIFLAVKSFVSTEGHRNFIELLRVSICFFVLESSKNIKDKESNYGNFIK
jgi:hypothetical protein